MWNVARVNKAFFELVSHICRQTMNRQSGGIVTVELLRIACRDTDGRTQTDHDSGSGRLAAQSTMSIVSASEGSSVSPYSPASVHAGRTFTSCSSERSLEEVGDASVSRVLSLCYPPRVRAVDVSGCVRLTVRSLSIIGR